MCTLWEDKKKGCRLRGRECLRSRMIMSRVLCWEDLIETQVQGDFKKHGKGFQCSEEQLGTLRFGAKRKLIH